MAPAASQLGCTIVITASTFRDNVGQRRDRYTYSLLAGAVGVPVCRVAGMLASLEFVDGLTSDADAGLMKMFITFSPCR